jgi:threonine dehydratase
MLPSAVVEPCTPPSWTTSRKDPHAQVYDAAIETPLDLAPNLSARIHNRIYFKREDMQPVFSFKLRGAYNKMASLSPAAAQARRDLRLAGNHAQGVALSARSWVAAP